MRSTVGYDRRGAPLYPIPVFMTMRLDGALLRPVSHMSRGKGTESPGPR
jgi:hypothetical protein